MDQNASPVLHTCAISGEQGPGKHYILKTTEGEEVVCPEALFHNGADRRLVAVIVDLQERVKRLEDGPVDQEDGGDQEHGQEDGDAQPADEKEQVKRPAAKKTAAKKTAAAADKGGE